MSSNGASRSPTPKNARSSGVRLKSSPRKPNVILQKRTKSPSKQSHEADWTEEDSEPSTPAKLRPKKAVIRRSPRPSVFVYVAHLLSPFSLAIKLLAKACGIVLSPIQAAITQFCLLLLVLGTIYVLVRKPVTAALSALSVIPAFSTLYTIYSHPMEVVTQTYCSTIGIGCKHEIPVGYIAKTVTEHATQAHDIFQSVVALGDPENLGLHHVELWELATAVKMSSELDGKNLLGALIYELGDATRAVKDNIISINSFGINAFTWIKHEFERIEMTIDLILQGKTYRPEDVAKQLDSLFERLDSELRKLLQKIEEAIPLADRASESGGRLMEEMTGQRKQIVKYKEQTPLWKRLHEQTQFKGRQLARDLQLTEMSIDTLRSKRRDLETARQFLVQYRDNVGYFKASMVGFHIADHQLQPEHEVQALRSIMHDFGKSIDEAKAGSKKQSQRSRELPGPPRHHRPRM